MMPHTASLQNHKILYTKNIAYKAAFCAREWQNIIEKMLTSVEQENSMVELCLLEDKDMAELNMHNMNCQGPTNILSFPSTNNPCKAYAETSNSSLVARKNNLGSLALSLDTAKREAFLYGQNLQNHSLYLLAHGLAHLLGYDHGCEMDEITEKMESAITLPLEK